MHKIVYQKIAKICGEDQTQITCPYCHAIVSCYELSKPELMICHKTDKTFVGHNWIVNTSESDHIIEVHPTPTPLQRLAKKYE